MARKRLPLVLAFLLATSSLASAGTPVQPQLPDFVYQGRLERDGVLVSGSADLAFTLWDAQTGGTQQGSAIIEPDYPVVGGLFSINLSFPGAFVGDQMYLEVVVDGVTLPRQPVAAVPVAQFALDAAGGGSPAAGTVQLSPAVPQVSAGAPLIDVSTSAALGSGTDPLLRVAHSSGGSSLLELRDDGALVAKGQSGVGSVPASGEGSRMMWYPARDAFRAGRVESFGATYWDEVNVGFSSAAFGSNTRASGDYSFAAGLATTASGNESAALGNSSTASGDRTLAFNGVASAVGAIALGSGSQATSDDSLALGPSSLATGLAAIAIGPSIATGSFGVAIGLQNRASGQFSTTIGKNACSGRVHSEHQTGHPSGHWTGIVVLGDGSAQFSSTDTVHGTANNQIVARGAGGFRFYTNMEQSAGVVLAAGSGSWASLSDRAMKENLAPVDGEDVLQRLRSLPVHSWNYTSQDESVRHIGPMAQDFHASFGVGDNERTITSVDADGVALAAVKALDARSEAQRQRIVQLEADNAALRERLDRLEALMSLQGHEVGPERLAGGR